MTEIDKQTQKIAKPTAFYHGKLQDGLALDPLSGFSRQLIQTAKRIRPDLEIGLCLETAEMFHTLDIQASRGMCNCVL